MEKAEVKEISMWTLGLAISSTITFFVMTFGEKMGDKPMPDDMKIWFMSVTTLLWILASVVADLKSR